MICMIDWLYDWFADFIDWCTDELIACCCQVQMMDASQDKSTITQPVDIGAFC